VDSRTEATILGALERLMAGRTTFMVAHRLSTVRDADLILVLNHGRIVEQGDHDELLAVGGLYAELHDAQTAARRGRAAAAVSSNGLSDLTRAVAEGGALSGAALAELAHAMAADAREGAWRLVAATAPLLERGEAGPLRALAHTGDQQAAQLLADLGLGAGRAGSSLRAAS
jgi:ABC-type multidrug transport system ATPase subunit